MPMPPAPIRLCRRYGPTSRGSSSDNGWSTSFPPPCHPPARSIGGWCPRLSLMRSPVRGSAAPVTSAMRHPPSRGKNFVLNPGCKDSILTIKRHLPNVSPSLRETDVTRSRSCGKWSRRGVLHARCARKEGWDVDDTCRGPHAGPDLPGHREPDRGPPPGHTGPGAGGAGPPRPHRRLRHRPRH